MKYMHGWTDVGKKLINSCFQLITFIGDLILQMLQKMMIGLWTIEQNSTSAILYSPGIIFMNEVPTLTVNFIGASSADNKTYKIEKHWTEKTYVSEDYVVINSLGIQDKDVMISSGIKSFKNYYTDEYSISMPYPFFVTGVEGDPYDVFYRAKNDGTLLGDWYYSTMNDDWSLSYKKDFKEERVVESTHDSAYSTDNTWIDSAAKRFLEEFPIYRDAIPFYLIDWKYNNNSFRCIGYVFYNGIDTVPVVLMNGFYEKEVSKSEIIEESYKKSMAWQLQGIISTWYKALRTIALVLLLSVLVYIGIRIILSSSSAQNKAKYKNMLVDWLVAICILFLLHYIMAFMLNLTDNLNNIMSSNVADNTLDGNLSDKLMNQIREKAKANFENFDGTATEQFGYIILYLALVILTLVFTFQYLKRVVFMAFLTMIAPMIALTYPLDKIKDGKAQAFSYWLREYIFNCLIQPVHLLLYTVFISSALGIAEWNPLYAIVVLAFMVPAEKIIKEMFGMKSNSPTNNLGAAAAGAMTMNMINKLKNIRGPKDDAGAGGESNPNGVRMANNAGTSGVGGSNGAGGAMGSTGRTGAQTLGASSTGTPMTGGSTLGASPTGAPMTGGSTLGASPTGAPMTGGSTLGTSSTGTPTTGSSTSRMTSSSTKAPSRNVLGGLNALGKRYIYGPDVIKSRGKKFTRALGGALGAVTAGTVALAAQVADGDLFDNPGKAMTDTLMGAGAGYAAGSALAAHATQAPEKIKSGVNDIRETYAKGAYGEEQYNKMQVAKEFFKSDVYKNITKDSSIDQTNIKERTQGLLNNGITDGKIITESLRNNISGDACRAYMDADVSNVRDMVALQNAGVSAQACNTYRDAEVSSVRDMVTLQNAGINAQVYKDVYKSQGLDDIQKIAKIKGKCPNLSDAQIASAMETAKDAPKDINAFIPWAKARFNYTNDKQAEDLYKNIVNFF